MKLKFTKEQIERIARKLCELEGLDPDEHVNEEDHTPAGMERLDMCVSSARWTQEVYRVEQFLALQQAISFVEQADA